MVQSKAPACAQQVLADIFLARIPQSEHQQTIRALASQVDNHTIDFVAALAEKCPDDEAEVSLEAFLVRAIQNGESAAAAAVCLQYPHIRETLLGRVGGQLTTSFALLLRQPKNNSVIIPKSDFPELVVLDKFSAEVSALHDSQETIRLAIPYLAFLKQLLRISDGERSFFVSSDVLVPLFCLLSASDKDVAFAARDACFAFFPAFRSGAVEMLGAEDDAAAFQGFIWQTIHCLLAHAPHSSYRTFAYAIWLRWLDIPESSESCHQAMQSDAYWQHIIHALASGDTEQRKLCLHILRQSLVISRNGINTRDMTLASEKDGGMITVKAQYDRFLTIFETIVIGRYLNQAEQCMKDLDALASEASSVQKSWLFALLEPALSPVTQDSIRKMLGNWLMSTDLKVHTHVNELGHLLRKSFMPWATQGHLFTSTLRGRTNDMQCEHGIRLAAFVTRLLQNHASDHELETRLCITRTVLDFLLATQNRIIASAVIYLLHGLLEGLRYASVPCIGKVELEMILDLSAATGVPEGARDTIQTCCLHLTQLTKEDVTIEDARLGMLTRKVQQLQLKSPTEDSLSRRGVRWANLHDFLQELQTTRHTCLQGDGLVDACRSLMSILDTVDIQGVKPEQLRQALDSTWTETEIQDYPQSALRMMPDLVLHPTLIASSFSDEGLSETLVSIFTQLHRFTASRIYMWAPLVCALRIALLKQPEAAMTFDIIGFVVDVTNQPPEARFEFQLEAAAVQLLHQSHNPHRSYKDYYGDHEEIGYAAFFDLLNRVGGIDESLPRMIYEKLIDPWENQKLPVPVVNKWKKTIQLQTMLILQEQFLPTMVQSEAQHHTDILHNILANEPLPRFRYLIEWMIARVIIRQPTMRDDMLARLSSLDHHSNPKYLSSLAKIAMMIIFVKDCPEDYAARLSYRLIALSASAKIIIRHQAQWSFPILWSVAESRGWTTITQNPASASLNTYIRSLERFTAPPTVRELDRLDPVEDHSLVNLLQGGYLRIEPAGEEAVAVADILELWNRDESNKHVPDTLPPATIPLGEAPETPSKVEDTLQVQASQQESRASARNEAFAALQTKGTAYLSASTTGTSEGDEEEGHASRATDLIVVGSLVDNAYNLGGLSRISEIFGASALYMSNPKSVLANKDFVSVAVSSHNHLPIHELAPDKLQRFLALKKTQGFAVVGVEQTDRSVLLGGPATKLPPKTLLVMGAEKEGIPPLVLGECDLLVEVPQRGVTRSMNVQTAAGVVLYEYSRQHYGKS